MGTTYSFTNKTRGVKNTAPIDPESKDDEKHDPCCYRAFTTLDADKRKEVLNKVIQLNQWNTSDLIEAKSGNETLVMYSYQNGVLKELFVGS